jgi:hypothetical protein
VLEAYRYSGQSELLAVVTKLANGLLGAIGSDGHLPGRLNSNWKPTVDWACLTGSVQNAHCFLMLYEITGDMRYRDAGFLLNQYVRRTIQVEGPPEIRGGVKGSFPIHGEYGQYEFLNWAVKFAIDSNGMEDKIRS